MKDDIVTLTIDDIGTNGEGIGKVDGYTLFVKDAVIGDIVQAKIIKEKKNYAYGKLLAIIKESKNRVVPKCAVAKQCGGCQIQQMDYQSQLQYKRNLVKENLEKIGGLKGIEILPIIGMDTPYHYRNKAQYPVGVDREGKVVIGFYAGRTHCIIDNTDCKIGSPINQTILENIRKYITEQKISIYDEESHQGILRHILIRNGYHTGEIMVCLVINGTKLPNSEKLVQDLINISGMTSILLNINREKTNVILGKECKILWGQAYIMDSICDITYEISPLSFFQINPVQTEKLYKKVLEFAKLSGKETVWDLYCGIGTISLLMATNAKKVYGVEVVPEAIENARNNAKRNNFNNVEFFVGKAEVVVPQFYEEVSRKGDDNKEAMQSLNPDVVVVDPPRKGCDDILLDVIVKMSPKRIVYVSCDSATLARDLKYLVRKGYEVKKVQPVDQFCHTVHVETVVLLSKGEIDSKKVRVEFSLEDMDMSGFQKGATYEQIKAYVLEHTGLKVSSLYISQVKRKCGLDVGQNYNLSKKEDAKIPQCPPDKEKAIMEALKYFGMV